MNPSKSETIFSLLVGALDFEDLAAVPEGKQNFVFSCLLRGEKSIVKVTDSRHRTRRMLEAQVSMLSALSRYNSDVCAPKPVSDKTYIAELELEGVPFYVTVYPYAPGRGADVRLDGYLMGQTLAKLHSSMRLLPTYDFEEIGTGVNLARVKSASQSLTPGVSDKIFVGLELCSKSSSQLLHGDFSSSNIRIEKAVTIFDFDNCVYGSAAYELANSLYMVLFDVVEHRRGDLSRYRKFRRNFLAGYASSSGEPVQEHLTDVFISYRVLLLSSWLQDPDDAPLFIRQAPSSWLVTLQKFVNTYLEEIEPVL